MVEGEGMNKNLLVIGLMLVLLAVGLSGCNEIGNHLPSEEDRFVGTWRWGEELLIFYSDGTYDRNLSSGIYEIKDEKLVLEVSNEPLSTSVYYYSFSDNDSKLTLTPVEGGLTTVLLRQYPL